MPHLGRRVWLSRLVCQSVGRSNTQRGSRLLLALQVWGDRKGKTHRVAECSGALGAVARTSGKLPGVVSTAPGWGRCSCGCSSVWADPEEERAIGVG